MKNKARVHRLLTEDNNPVSVPFLSNDKGVIYTHKAGGEFRRLIKIGYFKPQHLYITTDEEIKEGDYYIITGDLKPNPTEILQMKGGTITEGFEATRRKIIATTDPKLTTCSGCKRAKGNPNAGTYTCSCVATMLPQPSKAFMEEYCKAGGIDEVLVEYDKSKCGTDKDCVCEYIEQCYNPIYKLKLDSNNCIIIHPVEEKMYSRDEVRQAILDYGYTVTGEGDIERNLDKWIEENL